MRAERRRKENATCSRIAGERGIGVTIASGRGKGEGEGDQQLNINLICSGPIMPRINECLSSRQQMAPPEEVESEVVTCPAGCTPELFNDITEAPVLADENSNDDYTNNDPLSDSDLYEVDYVDEDKLDEVTESPQIVDADEYDYSSYDNEIDTEDSNDYDYSYDDYDEAEIPVDLPLEEDAVNVEEEEEEVEINIDEGFLNDENNEPVELYVNTKSNVVEPRRNDPPIFFFFLIGGFNADGSSTNFVDLLNTGLGNSAFSLSVAPLPLAVTEGGESSAAYTGRSITSCGRGVQTLSPYGYLYSPGSCYGYGFTSQRWEARGGKMRSFRKGASVTKLGRWNAFFINVNQKHTS